MSSQQTRCHGSLSPETHATRQGKSRATKKYVHSSTGKHLTALRESAVADGQALGDPVGSEWAGSGVGVVPRPGSRSTGQGPLPGGRTGFLLPRLTPALDGSGVSDRRVPDEGLSAPASAARSAARGPASCTSPPRHRVSRGSSQGRVWSHRARPST